MITEVIAIRNTLEFLKNAKKRGISIEELIDGLENVIVMLNK